MSKRSDKTPQLLYVAKLGRTVGLGGDMKLHISSDFPEQFIPGASFVTDKNLTVHIDNINAKQGTVHIEGYNSPEDAKRLVNAELYTTYEATREQCKLAEGEFFWFDIVGCDIYEDGNRLGEVVEIERIAAYDYLSIETDDRLVKAGEGKKFLLPYQKPFVVEVDIEDKRITVCGALDILQAS